MESKEIKQLIIDLFSDTDDVLFADGFDGHYHRIRPKPLEVVYSRSKVIDILCDDNMDNEEAVKFAEYNVFSSFVDEKTPVWVEEILYGIINR